MMGLGSKSTISGFSNQHKQWASQNFAIIEFHSLGRFPGLSPDTLWQGNSLRVFHPRHVHNTYKDCKICVTNDNYKSYILG